MTITLRSTKGSELTYAELDGNFVDLDNRTKEQWQNLSGLVTVPTTAPPTYVDYKGVQLLTFGPTENQEVTVRFHVPKDFVQGSDIYLHSHVVSPSASVGTVRWGFTMIHADEWMTGDPTPTVDQKFGDPITLYGENYKTALDQDLHRIVMTQALNIPNLVSDSVILCKYFRDGTHINDTYPDPVHLLFVDIYYRSQGFGKDTR